MKKNLIECPECYSQFRRDIPIEEALKGFVQRLNGDLVDAHKKGQFNEMETLVDIIQERLIKELKTLD